MSATDAAAAVEYGEGFSFQKTSLAERDRVLLLMSGEVFPEASDVPPDLRGQAATVQRAEYCLHRYLQEGIQFVESLNGTFALAILDRREGKVHLATDRFGHDLMFFSGRGGDWGFASSVRSLLLRGDGIGRTYNYRALAELIVFERVLGDRTLFGDIQRLPAGCLATWNGTRWEVRRYFEPRHRKVPASLKCWEDAAEELVRRLRHSIGKRLADQPKAGLFLSGGLDSRLVLGCCGSPVTTATFAHPGRMPREAEVASALARAHGAPMLLLERPTDHYARIARKASEVNEGLATFVGCHSLGTHETLYREGVRVVLTGDRSDVGFKAYFDGVIDTSGLQPWTASKLQIRRAARLLMSSPIIRRAERQDLMVLALSAPMKTEFATVWEQTVQDLCDLFLPGMSLEESICDLSLRDWQSFTSMGLVRGLATEFPERSPFYDNEVWSLSLSIPPAWRQGAQIVRRAVNLASPALARIPDASSGIPPCVSPTWNRLLADARTTVRDWGKKVSRYSKWLAAKRAPTVGTQILTWSGYHDRNAALRLCEPYRRVVLESVDALPAEFFDTKTIRRFLDEDLAADAPKHGSLFEILITFAQFGANWGPSVSRGRPDAPLS